jgi:DUF4097 and DUF4098 domain-containing protein YvlB
MRARNWIAVLGLVTAGLGAAPALADDCEFRADRNAAVDAAGVVKIVIRAGAGDLKVHGTEGRRIDARGEACAGKQTLLDQAQVNVRREGNVVYVETQLPQDNDGWNWGKNEYAYIDLGVTLPANIAVEATDSSGDASFEDLKSLSLQDSSGDLTLARIAGAVDVTDSSGDLEIDNAGSVRVNDSSGDLDIDDVKADVVVENDSSGDIRVTKVDGSVIIEQDSSGGIRVEDVRGSVTVNNDSSGDIYAGRVKGDFTVKNDSSGSIGHTAIGGKISVPRED